MIRVKEVFQRPVERGPTDGWPTDKGLTRPHTQVRKIYALRDCLLNPDYVVAIYPHRFDTSADQEMLADNFSAGEVFSRVILDGNSFRSSEIIVNQSYEHLSELLA
tara:strand:- start:60 stop:377 length:318 start_codon:yes stop_codon:yes gene_type:complete